MSRLPVASALKLEKILLFLEFEKTRQKGSHAFYRHPDGRTTTLPHHKGRDISRPLIKTILREIELSNEKYLELLEKV